MTDKFNPRDMVQLDALMDAVSHRKANLSEYIFIEKGTVPALIEEVKRLRVDNDSLQEALAVIASRCLGGAMEDYICARSLQQIARDALKAEGV